MLNIDYFKKNLENVEKFLLLHWFIPVMNVQMIKVEKISSIKNIKRILCGHNFCVKRVVKLRGAADKLAQDEHPSCAFIKQ